MLVILTAGIDLSVGSLVKVSILVSAIVMNGESSNVLPAIIATLALGVLVGLIHAFLINELRIAPFIVTLASLVILRGAGLTISSSPVGKASPEVLMFYVQKIGPVPIIALMFFALIGLTMLLLRYTVFGKHLYAVGGNTEVAHLSGVPVKRVRYAVYVLCSLTASVTGLLWLSRMGVGDPAIGDGIELQTITAVIIGGTSLFGGRASVSRDLWRRAPTRLNSEPAGDARRESVYSGTYSRRYHRRGGGALQTGRRLANMTILAGRPSVRALQPSLIRKLANSAIGTTDVIPLWFGEPDKPTPEFIRQAAKDAIDEGQTFYQPNLGIIELRAALAKYMNGLYATSLTADNIGVTPSGMTALAVALQCIVAEGDAVVVPSPVWPNLPSAAEIPGRGDRSCVFASARWRLDSRSGRTLRCLPAEFQRAAYQFAQQSHWLDAGRRRAAANHRLLPRAGYLVDRR